MRAAFPSVSSGASGMLPAVEDPGHVPGDAELEMLDSPGLQSPGWQRMVEGDPSRDTEAAFTYPFDCLISFRCS